MVHARITSPKHYWYEVGLIAAVILFAALAYGIQGKIGIFGNAEEFRFYVASFGLLAPLIVIFLTAVSVIIPPLPIEIPLLSSGFLFGTPAGTLYPVIGTIVGSSLAFFIARHFGKTAVTLFVDGKRLTHFESVIARRQNIIWLLYFIPVFPVDVLTYAIGMSAISYRRFLFITSLGFLVSIGLYVMFGNFLFKFYSLWIIS
ncbi:MAG: TVP38/TMEM64 family protein [Candidatus Portnoybacteria bacterium]|nr:TVP38/TMEM64 family protein [Candidatus Portnoybacteria bacterium]